MSQDRNAPVGGKDYMVSVMASGDSPSQPQMAGLASKIEVMTEEGPVMLDIEKLVTWELTLRSLQKITKKVPERYERKFFVEEERHRLPPLKGGAIFTGTYQDGTRDEEAAVIVATQRPRPDRMLNEEDLKESFANVAGAKNSLGFTPHQGGPGKIEPATFSTPHDGCGALPDIDMDSEAQQKMVEKSTEYVEKG